MRPFHPNHPLYERLRTLRGAVIVIEGIIGSGKTSLGRKLTQMIAGSNIPCKFFEEEVNDELLALFLKDMKKYAFTFQLFMLANR
jgi:deoxyadenosine/deoxycytidine kinase